MADRIAILGANGFIGQALTASLLAAGYRVSGGVRTAPGQQPKGLYWVERRFTQPEDFDELLRGSCTLIHCASSSTVASSSSHPVHEFDSDLRTSLALIEALQSRCDIHVIFLSSGGTVYGQQPINQHINEDTTPYPISYHGAAKLSVEHFFNAWAAQNKAQLTILRPSNVFGPGQPFAPGFGVIPALFKSAIGGVEFRIRGSLKSVRDYLYIDDFVHLVHQVITNKQSEKPIVVNVGSGAGTSLEQLITAVERICSHQFNLHKQSAYLGEVSSVILDISRAEYAFGWAPKMGLESGLEKTWDWWSKAQTSK